MRGLLLGVALALTAGAANAQIRTTCQPVGGQVVCDTTPAPTVAVPAPTYAPGPIMAPVQGFDLGRTLLRAEQLRAIRQQQQAAAAAQDATQADAQLQAQLARLIRDGRCADARAVALGNGRLDLADQVARVCSAAR